jgi:hypothetical protein
MKRFVYDLASKALITTEDKVPTYETWLWPSHASYTLDRYGQIVLSFHFY